MRNSPSLKKIQFVISSIILILSYILVIALFNLISRGYVKKIAYSHINKELALLVLTSSANTERWESDSSQTEISMSTGYILFNEKGEQVFVSDIWADEKGTKDIEGISGYFQKNIDKAVKKGKFTYTHRGRRLYAAVESYEGYFDGYMLYMDNDSLENSKYLVVAYANASPLLSFVNRINILLLIIMLFSLLLALAAALFQAKRLDTAFKGLQKYIYKAGQRKRLPSKPYFAYEEFYVIVNRVRGMTEMLKNAEESQKQFFANSSHELKTPLMSIQGYAEGLLTGILKDRERCLTVIIDEVKKMTALINEILMLARLDGQISTGRWEKFDIRELVLYCAGTIEAAASGKNIELEMRADEKSIYCNGNEDELEHAILNVLTNALRHAVGKIDVECYRRKDIAYIRIANDGAEISKEDLPHIFERFYKGKGGSSGIGLSITYEVIKRHKGKISVSSENGCTSFEIKIPLI